MQVWLSDKEAAALVTAVKNEEKKAARRADRAFQTAYKLSDARYALESLTYSLEDAIRQEMDAFDN